MNEHQIAVIKDQIFRAKEIVDDIIVIPSHETDMRLMGIKGVAETIVTSLTALLEE